MSCSLVSDEEHLCVLQPGSKRDVRHDEPEVNRLLKDTYRESLCFRGRFHSVCTIF